MQENEVKLTEASFTLEWGTIKGKLWSGIRGPNVICLHGMFSNSACYDGLVPLLAERVGGTWCCLDLPGSGRSDPYPAGTMVDFFQIVLDIDRVIKKLNWERCHVMAHSAGSVITLYLASFRQEIIQSIVLIDMMMYNLLNEPSFIANRVHVYLDKMSNLSPDKVYSKDEAISKIQRSRVKKLADKNVEAIFERCAHSVPEGFVLNNDPRFYFSYMYPLLSPESHNALVEEITCPVLLIKHSELQFTDFLNNHTVDLLKQKLGRHCTVVDTNSSHDTLSENPSLILPPILRHFSHSTSKI